MQPVVFWFEFASTYSYLSAMRIGAEAAKVGVPVVWRPFLLGPIFAAQGWTTSPFNIYPAKGRYMIRDMQRLAAARGLAFQMPKQFPAAGLKAARIATVGAAEGWVDRFAPAVYAAEFAHGLDIADENVLAALLDQLGLDSARILAASGSADCKERLRAATQQAQDAGIFGAPTFQTADGEIFWGDDRLFQALQWSVGL